MGLDVTGKYDYRGGIRIISYYHGAKRSWGIPNPGRR
jgi:hypothetical protein